MNRRRISRLAEKGVRNVKTRGQLLLRYQSGVHYARCQAGGKEHWINPAPTHFQIAQDRLSGILNEIRSAATKNPDFGKIRMTFRDAAGIFMQNPTKLADAKSSTVKFSRGRNQK